MVTVFVCVFGGGLINSDFGNKARERAFVWRDICAYQVQGRKRGHKMRVFKYDNIHLGIIVELTNCVRVIEQPYTVAPNVGQEMCVRQDSVCWGELRQFAVYALGDIIE